ARPRARLFCHDPDLSGLQYPDRQARYSTADWTTADWAVLPLGRGAWRERVVSDLRRLLGRG
ncbi:hypothetical protein CCS92_34945, partial [Methylobacterium radiotolerans]